MDLRVHVADIHAELHAAAEALQRAEDADLPEVGAKNRALDAGGVRAIEDGLYEPSMTARLVDLLAERAALQPEKEERGEAEVAILSHPNLPECYRRKVEQLEAVLDGPDARK